ERDLFRQRASTKSKDDGSFALDGVPSGEVTLLATAEDHALREVEIVVEEKTPPQEIALSSGGTIGGLITTVSGAPIEGRVYLSDASFGRPQLSDEASQFSFEHLPAGTYSIKT